MRRLMTYWLGGALMAGVLATAPAMAAITFSAQPRGPALAGGTVDVDIVVTGRDDAFLGTVDEIIRAYDLLLGYDTTLLTATAVTFGINNTVTPLNGGVAGGSLQSFVLTYDPAAGGPPGPPLPPLTTYNGPAVPPHLAVEFSELSLLCSDSLDTCPGFESGPYLGDIQALPPDFLKLATITFQVSPNAATGLYPDAFNLMDDSSYNPNPGLFNAKGLLNGVDLDITLQDGDLEVPEPGTLALFLSAGLLGTGFRSMRRWKGTAGG